MTLAAGASAPAQQRAADATALYRSGYSAFQSGDLAGAHAAFARLVKVAPQVAAAHTAYGEVLLAEGKPVAAIPQLERARALDPHDKLAAAALGRAEEQLGRFPAAVDAFAAASAGGADPLAPDDALAEARSLLALGKREAASAVLTTALAAAPESAALHDAAGVLLAQSGATDAALAEFSRATALVPSLASAQYHLGSLLLATSHPEDALAPLREASRLAPASAEYALQLGRALSATGADAEAVGQLERARTLAPKGTPVYFDATYNTALALQNNGAPAQALPFFAEVAAARPKDSSVLTNYALALVQTGDAKEAIPLYSRALAAGPPTATLREDFGVAYLQASALDQALEQFQAGLALEPGNAHLHYDLALAYKLKDNLQAAIPELQTAERLDPSLPDPDYTLGVLYMQQGDFQAAATQLETATTLRPGYGDAWAVLGSVYHQAGDQARAAEALRRAIALEPGQPGPHVTLGSVLAEQGDAAGAAAERKIAAALSRDATNAQRAQFSLRSGRALLEQKKYAEAQAQLETAISAEPSLAQAHALLAEALEKQRKPGAAAAERRKAESLAKTAPDPR